MIQDIASQPIGAVMLHVVGKLMGIIFGLIFTGAGFFMLSETTLPTFLAWKEMQSWQPHQAVLLTLEGADNYVKATYSYSTEDIPHTSDRVYVTEFNDNIGNYHRKLHQKLSQLQRTKQPVAIWINPRNHNQSVIDRDMRWGLVTLITLFCSVFVLFGLVFSWAILTSKRSRNTIKKPSLTTLRREWKERNKEPDFRESFLEYCRYRLHELRQQAEQKASQLPKRSWQEKKEWQTNRIRSDARSSSCSMWFFSITWIGISSPILFILPKELSKGNYAALLALLFPLVGIFLLYKAIVLTRELYHFGIVEYVMDPYPGAIGGNVGGSLEVKGVSHFEPDYVIELECVFSSISGSGKDRSRHESIKWAEKGHAKVTKAANGIRLSFRFDIPEDLPESDIDQQGDYYFWRLKVVGKVPGIDLNRKYTLPVFKTGETSRFVRHDLSKQMVEERKQGAAKTSTAIAKGAFHLTALHHSVKVRKRDRELLFIYPMFRNKLLTLLCGLFGGVFSFASFSILASFGGEGFLKLLSMVFVVPFVLIGLVGCLAAIYLPLNNLRVTISRGKVTILRRLFLLPIYYKQITSRDIKDLSLKRTGSTGQGTRKIEHYKIFAHTESDGTYTIAESINGKDLANQFMDYLQQRIKTGY